MEQDATAEIEGRRMGRKCAQGIGGMWKMEDKEVSSAEDVMYEPLYKCLHGRALAFDLVTSRVDLKRSTRLQTRPNGCASELDEYPLDPSLITDREGRGLDISR